MNCPSDGTTLLMSERQGVEIDYCPECRGVWLDRGELDKILERAQAEADAILGSGPVAPAPAAPAQPRSEEPRYDDRREPRYDDRRDRDRGYGDRRYDDRGYDSRSGYRKKKKPFDFLGDIFD